MITVNVAAIATRTSDTMTERRRERRSAEESWAASANGCPGSTDSTAASGVPGSVSDRHRRSQVTLVLEVLHREPAWQDPHPEGGEATWNGAVGAPGVLVSVRPYRA